MLVLYFGSGACCLSGTTLCHKSGMRMGKCKLIGVIHMCNYWTSTGSMIMFSHWWIIFEGSVVFCSYSELHASYGHLNSGMRFCAKWRKSFTDGKWCWTVCLTKLVPFCFAYLIFFCQSLTTLIWIFISKMSMYINEMLPTVLVFTVSTCQVNKQFSFLGLTQKSNLIKVTSFLISVHVTAV